MKTLRLTFKPWISSDYGNVFMLLIYSKVTSWERISHISSGIDQMFLQGFHITRSGSRKLPSRIRRNNGSLWKIEIVVCIMSWNAFCFTWKTTFVFAFNLRNQLICRPVFHATYRADKTRPRWGQFQTSEQWHSNFKVFFLVYRYSKNALNTLTIWQDKTLRPGFLVGKVSSKQLGVLQFGGQCCWRA